MRRHSSYLPRGTLPLVYLTIVAMMSTVQTWDTDCSDIALHFSLPTDLTSCWSAAPNMRYADRGGRGRTSGPPDWEAFIVVLCHKCNTNRYLWANTTEFLRESESRQVLFYRGIRGHTSVAETYERYRTSVLTNRGVSLLPVSLRSTEAY